MIGDLSKPGALASWAPINAPIETSLGESRGSSNAGSTTYRFSIVWILLIGPASIGLLAILVAISLGAGQLDLGSALANHILLAVTLAMLGSSAALAFWLHCVIAQPLRDLVHGGGTRRVALATMPVGPAVPREIALIAASLERSTVPPPPERDRLTGLLTAGSLREATSALFDQAAAAGHRIVLVVLDLERLRDINAVHGYGFGDEVLRQTARRLNTLGIVPLAVARIGGDRFAVLLPSPASADGLRAWVVSVVKAFERPFRIAGCDLHLNVHAGAAQFPEHGTGLDTLLRAAEQALEIACRGQGRRWIAYDVHLNRAAAAQRLMEKELRQAIEAQALVLHYQPQIDCLSGRVTGVEALLRWPHPEKGLIPPQSFIPLAEASGLIRPLGAWVLAEACRAARRWRDRQLDLTVSVNVSAAQLRHQDLPAFVAQVLQVAGLPPGALELELTESMFVDPTQLAMHRSIQGVAAMGVRLAIDDFGTGYSSLGYLKRLPVHKIKIDKSFVRDLDHDAADAAIVRSIIGLARTFGKRVLAEGVEEGTQYKFLLDEGCHEAQGYFFARPMPEDACTAFLLQHTTPMAGKPASERLLVG